MIGRTSRPGAPKLEHWNRNPRNFTMVVLIAFCLISGVSADSIIDREALQRMDPESALSAIEQTLTNYDGSPASRTRFDLLEARIEILRNLGRTEQAKSRIRDMQALADEYGDPMLRGQAARIHGTLLAETGDVASAMELFQIARLHFLEADGAQGELASVAGNIGTAYAFVGEYEHARFYFEQSIELARASGDQLRELRSLSNLALVTSRLEGSEAGLPFQRRALALAEEREETDLMVYQLGGLCSSLIRAGTDESLAEAEELCQRALHVARQSGHARPMAEGHLHLGNLRLAQDRFTEALEEFELALEQSEDSIPTIALEAHLNLAEVHETTGDHAAALRHYRRQVDLREAMFAEERRQMIAELDARYQLSERMQQIEALQVEAELKALKLQRRNWMLVGLTAGLVLIMALVLLAWRGYQVKSRLQKQLAARNRELEEALATISKVAREDPLTGLLNRRAFMELAARERARSHRNGSDLSIAIADIDHFKHINDQYGHQVGDEVLVELGGRLSAGVREVDVVCRWGGEEFMLLFPEASTKDAVMAIERLRRSVADHAVMLDEHGLEVTMTFGAAPVGEDLKAAIQAADRALYQGKAAGRNRVTLAADAA
jgi:diguanylate cyclase (GGDEF)-like protein